MQGVIGSSPLILIQKTVSEWRRFFCLFEANSVHIVHILPDTVFFYISIAFSFIVCYNLGVRFGTNLSD